MNMSIKHAIAVLVVIIGLIGLNVYQFQNPKVVEVPIGATEIDSTAWVQRNAYMTRGAIIDSLKRQNKDLSKRLKKTGDQVANYAQITGKLRVQRDSLKSEIDAWNTIPEPLVADDSIQSDTTESIESMPLPADSTFMTQKQFGSGLFVVTGLVEFKGYQFRQHLELEQIRDIRIDVATTVDKDRHRILTYVTSQDFETLEYKSFTTFKPSKKLPWFWIGLGTGVAGAALIINR